MSEAPSTSESTIPAPQQKRRSIWIIFLVLAGAYILVSIPNASAVKWVDDLDKGLKQASEQNQFALVMFDALWCGNCKQMKGRILTDAKVCESLKNWVPIKIDIDQQPKTKQAYMVDALPTFIIFSPAGRQIKRFEGTMPAEEFVKVIKSAKEEKQ